MVNLPYSNHYVSFLWKKALSCKRNLVASHQSVLQIDLATGGPKRNARRDNRERFKRACSSHIEAVIWCKVGDKLQSCRPKWFMESAESDIFCPLSSTNHCSLSQARPSSPESRRSRTRSQGSHRLTPHNTHIQTHPGSPLHAHAIRCQKDHKWNVVSTPLLPGNKT